MRLSDFDYHLPSNLIAIKPKKPRDHSRLLVLNKRDNIIEHKKFFNIVDYFRQGDVLILNNSKVIPARLIGKKEKTQGKVEVFLNKKISDNEWQCLLGGKRIKLGLKIKFNDNFFAIVSKNCQAGIWNLVFNKTGNDLDQTIEKTGKIPLPPYIEKKRKKSKESFGNDKNNYQTIYANKNKKGSVAASTAGFHWTKKLLTELKNKGVIIKYITLHVGLGTFAPIKEEKIEKHKIHSEWVEIKKDVIQTIKQAKKKKRKIFAVGTTSVRSLEAVFARKKNLNKDFQSWVDIYIYPGFKFKVVDAMITNFHLPKSSLIVLVSAFAKRENILKAYQEAIKKKYRFYSYGDAMLIF